MANWKGAFNNKSEDYEYHDLGQRLHANLDPSEINSNPPGWGCLIHPDELRHVLLVGNSLLVTINGEQLTDFQLKNWIDHNVRKFGQMLQHDIYPRLWRHRLIHNEHRSIEPFAEWEDPYDFDTNNRNNTNYLIKLRKKPVSRLVSWEVISAQTGRVVIDLTKHVIPNFNQGLLRASVTSRGTRGGPQGIPIAAYRGGNLANLMMYVDYVSGYDSPSRVPDDLKGVIMDRMVIDVCSAYGDGVVGGLSSSSVSVGVLSESIGTTMSATSAYFGARIAQLTAKEDKWKKEHALAYRGLSLGHT